MRRRANDCVSLYHCWSSFFGLATTVTFMVTAESALLIILILFSSITLYLTGMSLPSALRAVTVRLLDFLPWTTTVDVSALTVTSFSNRLRFWASCFFFSASAFFSSFSFCSRSFFSSASSLVSFALASLPFILSSFSFLLLVLLFFGTRFTAFLKRSFTFLR